MLRLTINVIYTLSLVCESHFDVITSFFTLQDSFGSLQVALTVTTESIRLAILRAEGLVPVDMHGSIGGCFLHLSPHS